MICLLLFNKTWHGFCALRNGVSETNTNLLLHCLTLSKKRCRGVASIIHWLCLKDGQFRAFSLVHKVPEMQTSLAEKVTIRENAG